jgi:carbon-monoxide dehydrogenase large subunit
MDTIAPLKFGMGAAPRRKEDRALLIGAGKFVDDFSPEGVLYSCVLRSSMAHARFRLGNLDAARAMPGVRLILTGADVADLDGIPCKIPAKHHDGRDAPVPKHAALALDIARHVGDPIAFVVADDIESARDAAEAIEADYEPLEVVLDTKTALEDGSPLVHPDLGTNVAFEFRLGHHAATDKAFETAAKVSRIEILNNRLVANYMEPRGGVAEYDPKTDRYTLTLPTQGGHGMRESLGKVLHVEQKKIRVITPDVGGGFGTKSFLYPEYPLIAVAAKRLGRPIKWTCERSEHFVIDAHGRDSIGYAEMAMDANGKFLAMRVDLTANMGAFLSQYAPIIPIGSLTMATGVYDIPHLYARTRGVYTNTVVLDAYRGAGRPEAAYLVERLVEVCARDAGLSPVEIRKRNFIAPEKMPYHTQGGRNYDTGEFAGHLDRALQLANHSGFKGREAEAKRGGKVRGFGIATYIEACAFPGSEPATVTLNTDGTVTLLIGTQTNGQGHDTAYSQFIADRLGIDYEQVKTIQGDTDIVPQGDGTGGSRSIPIGAVSVDRASVLLADQIKSLAAEQLEAAPTDLELADGRVRIAGTDRSITLAEVARAAKDKKLLTAVGDFHQPEPTYPNGTHIAEVEIDPETGATEIVGYWIVDDFGVTVNPMLLEGQVHGGVAQGIGQALTEQTVFDEDGQLLTASFLDYAIPRADDLPSFYFETRNIPAKSNALGIKGAGEAGSIGSSPAVMNAVVDALSRNYGVAGLDMPATPQRVWQAIAAARR